MHTQVKCASELGVWKSLNAILGSVQDSPVWKQTLPPLILQCTFWCCPGCAMLCIFSHSHFSLWACSNVFHSEVIAKFGAAPQCFVQNLSCYSVAVAFPSFVFFCEAALAHPDAHTQWCSAEPARVLLLNQFPFAFIDLVNESLSIFMSQNLITLYRGRTLNLSVLLLYILIKLY